MAYALVAGIDPVFGLYSGIVPPIVGAMFTHSKFMMITVTGEVALVAGAVLLSLGASAGIGALVTLTLLVGLIAFLIGALKLDSILRFVSNAVMTGFLTGTAILIAIGQLDELTGYTLQVDGNSLQEAWDWLTHIPQGDLPTFLRRRRRPGLYRSSSAHPVKDYRHDHRPGDRQSAGARL